MIAYYVYSNVDAMFIVQWNWKFISSCLCSASYNDLKFSLMSHKLQPYCKSFKNEITIDIRYVSRELADIITNKSSQYFWNHLPSKEWTHFTRIYVQNGVKAFYVLVSRYFQRHA